MYYAPNILVRRSRKSGLLLKVSPTAAWDYQFSFTIASGQTVSCDFGDGTSAVLTSADSNVTQTHSYAAGTYTAAFSGGASGAVIIKSSYRWPVVGCNFNWSAFPLLTNLINFMYACPYANGVVKTLPAAVTNASSAFGSSPLLTIAPGFVLPAGMTVAYRLFSGCTAMTGDINDLGASFPLLTNISEMFQNSGFYGDATAFKNKCAANVTYSNAFAGSLCTNIPA